MACEEELHALTTGRSVLAEEVKDELEEVANVNEQRMDHSAGAKFRVECPANLEKYRMNVEESPSKREEFPIKVEEYAIKVEKYPANVEKYPMKRNECSMDVNEYRSNVTESEIMFSEDGGDHGVGEGNATQGAGRRRNGWVHMMISAND